jgi:uncharacterized delta-60 repeat protein
MCLYSNGFTRALTRARTLLVALALSQAYSPLFAIPGQPGTLDPSWGTLSPLGAGKVVADFGPVRTLDVASGMALQPDGKVIVAGTCFNGSNNDFCVARFSANGDIDTSFGTSGSTLTPVSTDTDIGTAVALQPDGKIVLVGRCREATLFPSFRACAARYTTTGALDVSFGSGGKWSIPTDNTAAAALALQGDGKIVMAGECGNPVAFCVIRLTASGSLDSTFGSSGLTTTAVATTSSSAKTVSIQTDGKIILAGVCYYGSSQDSDICTVRYTSNGVLDASYNGTGLGEVSPLGSRDNVVTAAVLQPDGKLIVAGYCTIGFSNNTIIEGDFCSHRFNSDGRVEIAYNGPSNFFRMITPIGSHSDRATAVALQADGKILMAGICNTSTGRPIDPPGVDQFCMIRYNGVGGGSVDTSFGIVITSILNSSSVAALAIQPDGKIVLAGTCANTFNGTPQRFCVARYDGGPFTYRACSLDIDGDNSVLATTDMLIGTRVALGMSGNAVIGGINFPTHATRRTWTDIRDYLVAQCGMSLP